MTCHPSAAHGGHGGRDPVLRAGTGDLTRAADLFRPTYDRTDVWTGGCRWKCRRSWLTTRSHPHRGQRAVCRAGGRICSSRSRAQGRPAAIEEAIFAWHAGQRHSVVLSGTTGGGRGIPAWHRVAHRASSSPRSAPLPRCSSALDVASWTRCLRRGTISSASPWRSGRTKPIARC